MMVIDNKHNFGDTVYLITDPDQCSRLVIAVRIDPGNVLMYLLRSCEESNWFYEFEMTNEPDTVKKVK